MSINIPLGPHVDADDPNVHPVKTWGAQSELSEDFYRDEQALEWGKQSMIRDSQRQIEAQGFVTLDEPQVWTEETPPWTPRSRDPETGEEFDPPFAVMFLKWRCYKP
jgi:hypothetical protein